MTQKHFYPNGTECADALWTATIALPAGTRRCSDMKKGGLLESLVQKEQKKYCLNCGNLIQVPQTSYFGCIAHDKLIMPAYLPYSEDTNLSCPDWQTRGD